MYDRSNAASYVNEARLDLFVRKKRTYDAIPSTSAKLRKQRNVPLTRVNSYGVRELSQIRERAALLIGAGFKVKRYAKTLNKPSGNSYKLSRIN